MTNQFFQENELALVRASEIVQAVSDVGGPLMHKGQFSEELEALLWRIRADLVDAIRMMEKENVGS
jgi:hypothetical protein